MGLFGIGGSDSSSTQKTTNAPQTASDQGLNQGASGSGAVSAQGAIVLGKSAKYQESGSVDLSNSKGQIGGYDLSKASDVTINEGGDSSSADASVAALTAALQATSTASQTSALANAATAQAQAQSQAAQAQSQQAAPVSLWTKFQNWLSAFGLSDWEIAGGVAVLALLAWLIFHRRKRT